jgi:outer membrane protein assembly factor BamE (lipoprotein component of BamABCDE complex)
MSIAVAGIVALCLLAFVAMSGCISSHSDVTYGPEGPAVRAGTFHQVKVGQTSREWLLGVFGEPTRTAKTPDGAEVMTYVYSKKVSSNFSFSPFLDLDGTKEHRTTYYFELRDGVVSKCWSE